MRCRCPLATGRSTLYSVFGVPAPPVCGCPTTSSHAYRCFRSIPRWRAARSSSSTRVASSSAVSTSLHSRSDVPRPCLAAALNPNSRSPPVAAVNARQDSSAVLGHKRQWAVPLELTAPRGVRKLPTAPLALMATSQTLPQSISARSASRATVSRHEIEPRGLHLIRQPALITEPVLRADFVLHRLHLWDLVRDDAGAIEVRSRASLPWRQ